MKKIILLALLMGSMQIVSAQQLKKIKMNELLKMIDTTTQPMVVNFWATWCGPCIREIPWFEKTIAQFADKKVKLLLVSLDYPGEYPKGIQEFVKKNKYKAEVIWLNETNEEDFCPKVDKSWEGTIPVSLMVNNKNHYRQFYNQQLPEARLVQELEKLVK